MIENIQVQNGDFMTLAKVVNGNAASLDSGLKKLTEGCYKAFNIVDQNMEELDKRINGHTKALKNVSKSLKWFGFGMMVSNITMFMIDRRVYKLEKRIKELEDKKVVNDFMTKEDFDFMKKDEDFDCLK